ncbi:hypothetical protein D1872_275070 [compost metagenome]
MLNVVQHQPADRDRLQVLVRRVPAHNAGVLVPRLHGQRDEHHEAVCFVLKSADLQHVANPVLMRFDRSVKHGCMRFHSQLVRCPVNIQVLVDIGFFHFHFLPVLIGQNFRSAAGQRF